MLPVRDPDLDTLNLSGTARETLGAVASLPFASAAELAPVLGRSPGRVSRSLQRLAERGLVVSDRFRFGVGAHDRWRLALSARSRHLPARHGPHPPSLLEYLLPNLDLVAGVYRCVGSILDGPGDRSLSEFRWRRGGGFAAVARFTDGWVGFVWSGVWHRPWRLAQTLVDCRDDCPLVGDGSASRSLPGRWCWVVPDAWQAYLVAEHLEEVGFAAESVVFDVSTGTAHGSFHPIESSAAPSYYIQPDLSPVDVAGAVETSLYVHRHARHALRLVQTAEQWPDLGVHTLARLASCHRSRSVELVEELVRSDYLVRRDDGTVHASARALNLASRRDRVWRGRPGRHYRPGVAAETPVEDAVSLEHERGLGALVARFRDGGRHVAPGWRGVENHGSDGSIYPDAMVHLSSGPFGPGWYYVEYERSARYPSSIRRKFRAMLNPAFTPRFPFLYICRSSALRHFLDASEGLPVAVATTDDVRMRPVLGEETCWLVDRQFVSLGE